MYIRINQIIIYNKIYKIEFMCNESCRTLCGSHMCSYSRFILSVRVLRRYVPRDEIGARKTR